MAYFPVLYRQAWEMGIPNPADHIMDTFRAHWVGEIDMKGSLLEALSAYLPTIVSGHDDSSHQQGQQLLQRVLQLPADQRAYIDHFYFAHSHVDPETVNSWELLGQTLWALTGHGDPTPARADLMAKYHIGQADFDEASTLRHWVDADPTHADAFEALFQVHDTLMHLPESVRAETFWPAFEASLPSSPSEETPAKAVSRFSLRIAIAMMIGLLFVALCVWLGWFG